MNKTILCSAIGASLAAGLAAPAQAITFSVLIPYVVKDSNRTTLVTLIGNGAPVSAGATVHLQYWTKSTTDANTAACSPNSVTVPFTENDIMTFDTAGLLGYPLFGDTTNPVPLGTAISFAGPRHGYLVAGWRQGIGAHGGYWLEIDLANGGAHGDVAARFPSGPQQIDGAMALLALSAGRPVSFWPSSAATSAFTVTPLGSNMETRENNQVVLQVFNSGKVQGAYDRNENGVDGTVPQTVRCVGRLTPAQLMPGVAANAAWAAQGGWGWLVNLGNGDATYNGYPEDINAMVYQVDSGTVSGKFMSNVYRIANDDGFLIQ